jgi:Na+-transporting methylmalonyl-CoA/oxaloacetate decarboxylase beta subunit
MNEPLSCYNVTVTVGCDGGYRPDPAAFAVAADQAAWGRSASIISAHLADKIISVVTVAAPDRYAAVAVARAVVSDALKRQALSSSRSADDRAHHRAEVRSTSCS